MNVNELIKMMHCILSAIEKLVPVQLAYNKLKKLVIVRIILNTHCHLLNFPFENNTGNFAVLNFLVVMRCLNHALMFFIHFSENSKI